MSSWKQCSKYHLTIVTVLNLAGFYRKVTLDDLTSWHLLLKYLVLVHNTRRTSRFWCAFLTRGYVDNMWQSPTWKTEVWRTLWSLFLGTLTHLNELPWCQTVISTTAFWGTFSLKKQGTPAQLKIYKKTWNYYQHWDAHCNFGLINIRSWR